MQFLVVAHAVQIPDRPKRRAQAQLSRGFERQFAAHEHYDMCSHWWLGCLSVGKDVCPAL